MRRFIKKAVPEASGNPCSKLLLQGPSAADQQPPVPCRVLPPAVPKLQQAAYKTYDAEMNYFGDNVSTAAPSHWLVRPAATTRARAPEGTGSHTPAIICEKPKHFAAKVVLDKHMLSNMSVCRFLEPWHLTGTADSTCWGAGVLGTGQYRPKVAQASSASSLPHTLVSFVLIQLNRDMCNLHSDTSTVLLQSCKVHVMYTQPSMAASFTSMYST